MLRVIPTSAMPRRRSSGCLRLIFLAVGMFTTVTGARSAVPPSMLLFSTCLGIRHAATHSEISPRGWLRSAYHLPPLP